MTPLLLFCTLWLTQAPPPAWPPPDVVTGATRVALVSQVKPTYPEAGIRARIQGVVTLQFVVEADGTVGPVRVLKSLSEELGMDAAAIAALKQWRFTPATKDGVAVRTLATASLTFTLNDSPPPIALPRGFDTARAPSGEWTSSERTVDGVRMQLQLPVGWQLRPLTAFAAEAVHAQSRRSLVVYRPMSLPSPLPFPMQVSELSRFSEAIRAQYSATRSGVTVVDAGQSPLGPSNWVWLELALADDSRAWAFITMVGPRMVHVLCSVETPTLRMTESERDAAIATARTDCALILTRLTLSY